MSLMLGNILYQRTVQRKFKDFIYYIFLTEEINGYALIMQINNGRPQLVRWFWKDNNEWHKWEIIEEAVDYARAWNNKIGNEP